ncbi:energy-coupling factor transporter ATP-binding protein EcfA2 [Paenibacillus rhizosphaerae]|uniref:Energy-coupling factor transporter ATP-binding protein EcfA2 n=1 Tax=Paenibacillus rhizosphaerae TaxID=297318 RepID=A0A839U3H2_9BACL|nr:ATP-binding protein [Paenibacillus rhizosphaerae]MBB3132260.1 energy-coupling factor transporter ATP-binding protein EcfA2 [Paenibacillus rhizosphaerae]
MSEPAKQQSNPFSTGGGGGNFETRVQAAFVVLMLTGRIAPCLPPWPITRIKLQGRYAGFHTDDFIVYTQDPLSGTEARLLAQLKHSISITEGNDTFGEVIQAAWNDFNDPSLFNIETDAFALITGPLSAAEINNTRTLLEWARHCVDSKEFLHKVNTSGFSNETKRSKLEVLKYHLKRSNGGNDLSDEQLWKFLKSFHLLGYDLDTESGSSLSLIQSLIALSSTENASLLWSSILDAVQTGNQTAGTLTLENLPEGIRREFNTVKYSEWDQDLKKLKAHGEYIIEGIKSDIGEVHINRTEYFDKIIEVTEGDKFVFLTGERGCGKSGLIKEFAEHMKDRAPVFCLRTEDLDKPHLDQVFSGIGLSSSLNELEAGFALIPKKYLLLESLEKLLELKNTAAFTDLIRFVLRNQGWTIIASGRDYAYQQIMFNYLSPAGVKCSSLLIENFKDEEIQTLCARFEHLQPLSHNQLLKNPYYAELAYRVVETGTRFSSNDGEREFKIAVWRNVISKEQVRIAGMPLKRIRTFIDIAVSRAKQMVYGVPEISFDYDALLKLEEDNLIRRDSSNGLVSLSHDILEDWGLERYIDEAFQANFRRSVREFLNAIGHEPAMNRAYRLWLQQKMKSGESVSHLIIPILNDKTIESCWRDETITAVLLCDNPYDFLNELKNQLFENDGELLKRFCFILRISCKTPNQELVKQFPDEIAGRLSAMFLKPYGVGWQAIIRFLFENRVFVVQKFVPSVTAVLKDWSALIHIDKELPDLSREAGLLALHLLDMLKDSYRDEGDRKKILGVIIGAAPVIFNEFSELLDRDVFVDVDGRRRKSYVKELLELALTGIETIYLCKHIPDTVIRLAKHEWAINESKPHNIWDQFRHKDVPEYFGLDNNRSQAFSPASGAKGPFVHLLRFHPRKGLDFIIELLNYSAEKYAHSDLDSPEEKYSLLPIEIYRSDVEQIEFILDDGTTIKQYSSQRLWDAYRGHSVVPAVLQSALMALENWLIATVEGTDNMEAIEWIFNHIMRNSNSVMPTAVLVSVATGHPGKLAKVAFPLMRVPELYEMDLIRSVHEMGERGPNWHALSRDTLAKVYSEERRTAALRSWRKEHLENLITCLQFTEHREETLTIIDDLRSRVSSDESWQFRFHRIDSRGWEPEVDEENNQIVFTSKNLEPHLKEIQQKSEAQQEITNRFMALLLWSEKVLKNEPLESEYFSNWSDALKESKSLYTIVLNGELNEFSRLHPDAITKAVTIFIRDHSTEMEEDDLSWCKELLTQAVLKNADNEGRDVTLDNTDLYGASAAATVLPKIFDFIEETDKYFVKNLIAVALTHSNSSVRVAASNGVKMHLWVRDSDFADKCVAGAIEFSKLESEELSKNRNLAWEDFKNDEGDEESLSWVKNFRNRLVSGDVTADIESISFLTHSPWNILNSCLMIPDGSTEPDHILLFSRMLILLFEAEEAKRAHRYEQENELNIPYELPIKFAERFANYFLSIFDSKTNVFIEELRCGCDSAPEFMSSILLHIEYQSEKLGNKEIYWRLWKQLSDKVQGISLDIASKQGLGYRGDDRTKLIRNMLHVDLSWQKVDYESQDIALGKEAIIEFVKNTGVNSDVFEAMASLMYHFPSVFLDPGLLIISKYQRDVGGTQLLSGVNTTYYLLRCIQRFLLVDNTETISSEWYQACLILLDAIVEMASSEAYYLREHLIRSRRIVNGLAGLY